MAMSTVSRTLGAHAAPLTVEHAGKVYPARPISQKVKSAFERWLQARVLTPAQELAIQNPAMTGAMQVVLDRIDEGRYSFHGKVAMEAIRTPDGFFALSSLVFELDPDQTAELVMAKPVEVGNVVAQLIRDSFPDAVIRQAEEQDPNAPGPKVG